MSTGNDRGGHGGAEASGAAGRRALGALACAEYLQTTFAAARSGAPAGRERRLQSDAGPARDPEGLGELLDALRQHLDHLFGLCQRAEQFSAITGRILVALRHWCRTVEDDLGPLPLDVMNQWSRQATELVPESSVGIG